MYPNSPQDVATPGPSQLQRQDGGRGHSREKNLRVMEKEDSQEELLREGLWHRVLVEVDTDLQKRKPEAGCLTSPLSKDLNLESDRCMKSKPASAETSARLPSQPASDKKRAVIPSFASTKWVKS